MRSNQLTFDTPHFTILSEDQKEDIHLATLEVLRRTGVRVFNQEALELLRRAGCSISDGNRVRIPAHLVEEAVRMAPPSITVHDRNGSPAMSLAGTNVYYGTGSDLPTVIDLKTGERRRALKRDIVETATVCDALPNIDFVMSMALPSDVPVSTSDLHSFEAMVTSTTKPMVYTAHDQAGLSTIIEMAAVVAGGVEELSRRPFLILYAEPTTPLLHSSEAVEKLLTIAENNLPVVYVPGSVAGAAAPVTMAGAMVVDNAELLSGLLIAQLKRPGAPCIFGVGTPPLDMRTTVAADNAPEFMLVTSAMAEMGRYYNLPTWGFAGLSDSKLFDEQASLEGAIWSLLAALNGVNLAHDVGYVESALTRSFEMLVTMNDVIGMVKRFMGGIEVTEETLALDLIDQIGPGGHFLGTEHTLRHFRENWYPGLLDRHNYEDWAGQGKKTLGQRANERAKEILESHRPEPLSPSIAGRLAEIIGRQEQSRG